MRGNNWVRRTAEKIEWTKIDDLKEERAVHREVSNSKIGEESDEVGGVCGENR